MPLVYLTLGLIAERLAPSGTLHTVGVIDVVVAVIALLLWGLVLIAKSFE